ncbi:MAG: hypothetical protein EA416_01525 [Trueperaceae bacterium]|nr:MAG: hypothetical protein EA416_01525 [Trueperaceae bacterium]
MHRIRPAITLLALSACLALLPTALAQGAPFEAPSHDVRFEAPQGWQVNQQVDGSGLLTVELHHPSGGGVVVVAAAPITPADQAYWSQPGHVLLTDVWTGFRPEVPGAQEQQRYEIALSALRGHVLDYASEQVAGTIVVAVGPVAAFTLISAADRERLSDVQNALELVVSSFHPMSVARGEHGLQPEAATPDAPANPLDPAPAGPGDDAAANPLDPAPAAPNPLDPPAAQPANPLDRTAPATVDPFVGRFTDPDVTLVLDVADGGYAGEIVVLGAPYPVRAALVDGRLDGSFGVGEQRFAFSAELTGDTLMLESDGARFALQRRP